MDETSNSFSILDLIWDFFKSIQLTVVVLILLATTSIIGTLIPQNENPDAYVQAYGEVLYRVLYVFDIFDMYHSWWFQFLIILLTTNIVICSWDRLSGTWKIVFSTKHAFSRSNFQKHGISEEFTDKRLYSQLQKVYEPLIARKFGYYRVETVGGKGITFFAEKGRWTRFGVYGVHLSIVLLLIGSFIGSIFGFDGYVNIPEGESVNHIQLRNSKEILPLGFEIQCDDFDVSFYESGAPKEYRSSLTILDQKKSVRKKDIIVNDPLRYKGINMFQSSYGNLPPNKLVLTFVNQKTKKNYKEWTSLGEQIKIPYSNKSISVKEHSGNYNFKGTQIGEAFICEIKEKGKDPFEVILPTRFPSFDRMRKGDWVISVAEHEHRYYTGLQVTKDPGVWVVYAGFIIMIIGCYISFFMAHQKICIEVSECNPGSRVRISGLTNKNRLGMQDKIKKLSDSLKAMN